MARGEEDARYFGLQYFSENLEGELGYYVGIGCLPEAPGRVLKVCSRELEATPGSPFRIDYVRTYAACAADAEVSQHLDRCLTVYADETPVELPDDEAWSPLIALAYLQALYRLVQRHLRRGFITREETLRGRICGQTQMGRYTTQSLARSRPEIVPCRFQSLEPDTLENRILRTALVGAKRLLEPQTGLGDWRTWARQADAALAGAAIVRIEPRDFQTARRTGAYRHYASPLALARAVLTRVGFDPSQPLGGNTVRMVPFRLATAELFERYVEACLRSTPRASANSARIWAGYHNNNLGGF